MISRRRFLQLATATFTGGVGVGLYTWQFEPHWLDVARRTLPIVGLPSTLHGRTLVQLSDIHVGPQVSDSYLAHAFDTVRALSPDIVAYTGDFISDEPKILDHAATVYDQLPRGRIGTVGVLGNHDFGPRWASLDMAARLAELLDNRGLRILRNEVAEIEGLQLAGMDEFWANQFDPTRTIAALDLSRAALVLSHNPDTVDELGWKGYEGWILSGHTHGGQCKPPFLPPPLLPVRNRRYTSGVFELTQNRRLYISRGLGHLLQVRFNARPEITVFELQSA
jgi:predicted MPP superfamily phosphohydrolase